MSRFTFILFFYFFSLDVDEGGGGKLRGGHKGERLEAGRLGENRVKKDERGTIVFVTCALELQTTNLHICV